MGGATRSTLSRTYSSTGEAPPCQDTDHLLAPQCGTEIGAHGEGGSQNYLRPGTERPGPPPVAKVRHRENFDDGLGLELAVDIFKGQDPPTPVSRLRGLDRTDPDPPPSG